MVSRNPEELREELEGIEFEGSAYALTLLRSEADRTVERQLDAFRDVDTKASRMLRLNVLLVGVIVSTLSIASQLGSSSEAGVPVIEQFENVYIEVGVAALVVSTALAAVTYSATEYDVGVSADNVRTLLDADLPTEETRALLVKNSIARINFNRSTNLRNIPLISATVVFAVIAVVLFALGAYQATIRPVPWWLSAGAMLVVAAVAIASGLVKQTHVAVRDVREWH